MAMLLASLFALFGFAGNLFRQKARREEHSELATSWSYITFVSAEFTCGAFLAACLPRFVPLPILIVATLIGAMATAFAIHWVAAKRSSVIS